jgi:hypothetical protein
MLTRERNGELQHRFDVAGSGRPARSSDSPGAESAETAMLAGMRCIQRRIRGFDDHHGHFVALAL